MDEFENLSPAEKENAILSICATKLRRLTFMARMMCSVLRELEKLRHRLSAMATILNSLKGMY